ncbi:MAG: hypothetical protein JKY67_02800 [Pseudomonadales bacterium]|nr:hypothetical protein [Pseudomonadales bacterium]
MSQALRKVTPINETLTDNNYTESDATSVELLTSNYTPKVIRQIREKISDLSSLAENWDGYNAKKISQPAFYGALDFAIEMILSDTPMPDIFPVPNGNIQMEWSCYGIDLEVEIKSQSTCIVLFEDLDDPNNQWEEVIGYDRTKVSEAIKSLTLRHRRSRDN